MGTSVFCFAASLEQSERIVNEVHAAGVSLDDISILFPDTTGTRDFVHEHHTKAPEGAAAGGGTGGLIGGTIGLLAGIGALAIPGIGPFIAAGPIMATLSGAAMGATLGGLTGAMVGMGIPEYEARIYEGKVKEGKCLISVHAGSDAEVAGLRRILARAGAEEVSSRAEERV